MIIDEDGYLAHHGVKGMKWGVRRNRPPAKTTSSKPKKPPMSTSGKIGLAFAGALLIAQGTLTLAAIKMR